MCEEVQIDHPVAVPFLVTLKICSKCHVAKPVTEFNALKTTKDGLSYRCKECHSKAGKALHEKNKARVTVTIPEFKTCYKCCLEKHSSAFVKDNARKDGLSSSCKDCQAKAIKLCKEKNAARDIIITPESKTCPGCKAEKPSLEFNKSKRNKDGLCDRCKECETVAYRKRKYGLSPEQYQAMLEAQGGACAICKWVPGPEDRGLDVDHIHGTVIIRGLLHGKCNRGLGYFKDSVEIIGKAIEYLNGPSLGILYKPWLSKSIKDKILASQGYMCKICSIDLHNKVVDFDHCHETGMVRGALCHGCNCGLGQFDESVELLTRAIGYLQR